MSVRLTPEAYWNGLALALPQEVVVASVRAKGHSHQIEHLYCRARQVLDARFPTYTIPIEGPDERLAAAGLRA